MGVFDGFANRFRMGDDDDDYEDDELNEYDDEEDEKPSRPKGLFGGRRQQSYDDEDDYEEPSRGGRTSLKGNSSSGGRSSAPAQVPARSSVRANGSKMQVRIIKPSSFDQSRQITDTLLAHRTVLLNLEGLDVNTAQRIVDFASGSCYALHGNFMKISHYIIVITPEDVDIAGDIVAAGGQGQAAVASAFAAGAVAGQQNRMGGMNGMNGTAGMNDMAGMNGMAGMGETGGMQGNGNNPFMNGMNGMNGGY